MDVTAHFHHSTLRERIVEHVFVGDTLRTLWRCRIYDVEVLRSEFDAHGYDLVLARGRIVRHIQFKTGSGAKAKPSRVSIASSLAEKPSGCVIWIRVQDDLEMGPFFWFGGAPGEALPTLNAYANPRRPTRNKEGVRPIRQNHREVPGNQFRRLDTLEDVLVALFGPLVASEGDSELRPAIESVGALAGPELFELPDDLEAVCLSEGGDQSET